MNKRKLAKLLHAANMLDQMADSSFESSVHMVELSFSNLATLDPEAALGIIEQLTAQKPILQAAIEDRKQQEKENIETIMRNLGPMSFDDSDDDEEGYEQ